MRDAGRAFAAGPAARGLSLLAQRAQADGPGLQVGFIFAPAGLAWPGLT
jgi:hypothetical protein